MKLRFNPGVAGLPACGITAGAAVCALRLLGFTGQAAATTRPILTTAPSLIILAADEENAEVQNLLEPE